MTVIVSPANCLSPQWQRDYFPDDLPPDWQLDYLANEYSGALAVAADLDAIELGKVGLPEALALFQCASLPSSNELVIYVVCDSTEPLKQSVRLSRLDECLWQSQPISDARDSTQSRFSLSTGQALVTIKRHLLSLPAEDNHYFFLAASPRMVSDTKQLCELLSLS